MRKKEVLRIYNENEKIVQKLKHVKSSILIQRVLAQESNPANKSTLSLFSNSYRGSFKNKKKSSTENCFSPQNEEPFNATPMTPIEEKRNIFQLNLLPISPLAKNRTQVFCKIKMTQRVQDDESDNSNAEQQQDQSPTFAQSSSQSFQSNLKFLRLSRKETAQPDDDRAHNERYNFLKSKSQVFQNRILKDLSKSSLHFPQDKSLDRPPQNEEGYFNKESKSYQNKSFVPSSKILSSRQELKLPTLQHIQSQPPIEVEFSNRNQEPSEEFIKTQSHKVFKGFKKFQKLNYAKPQIVAQLDSLPKVSSGIRNITPNGQDTQRKFIKLHTLKLLKNRSKYINGY